MCTHKMAALLCVKQRHGRHLEIMTSYKKSSSINQYIYDHRSILLDFILILFVIIVLILIVLLQQEQEHYE